jgi:hypothetical protein
MIVRHIHSVLGRVVSSGKMGFLRNSRSKIGRQGVGFGSVVQVMIEGREVEKREEKMRRVEMEYSVDG